MKQLVRMQHSQKRNSLSREEVEKKSTAIAEKFLALQEVKGAATIMLYVGIKNEVQTKDLIEKLLAQGKKVIVPVTDFEKREIALAEIHSLDELVEKGFGLLEPKNAPTKPLAPEELRLIVVPGIAFDRQGVRIGTGFGFYDKLLRRTSTKVPLAGLCFSENLEERLPAESHDVKMNIIVTDREVLRCRA